MRLLLASRSPQRRAILTQLGMPFRVLPSEHHEETVAGDPVATVERNARGKAQEVAARASLEPDEIVLGVDTVVVLDGEVLGKAAGAAQAREYLERLAGRTHQVVSGLCLIRGDRRAGGHALTTVTFRPLSAAAVARYVSGGEWRHRAGAYAIQGLGSSLVRAVDGDYFNVVGLPVALLCDSLEELGVDTLDWIAGANSVHPRA
jgi:septum formation protein